MSRDASIELDFGDGTYKFRLAWGELEALQEACDAGPSELFARLLTNKWRVGDISNTIRLGLIGGGIEPQKALTLVRTYVEARPPLETLAIAQGVLGVGLQGTPEEKSLGEAGAAPETENQ